MNVCIVPGLKQSKESIEFIYAELLNDRHIVTIGHSTIDENFDGTKDGDLTNLNEYDLRGRLLKNNISDAFIFLEPNLQSLKAITRILSSVEQLQIPPKKLMLYRRDVWANFTEMLQQVAQDIESQKVLKGILIIDSLKIGKFS